MAVAPDPQLTRVWSGFGVRRDGEREEGAKSGESYGEPIGVSAVR